MSSLGKLVIKVISFKSIKFSVSLIEDLMISIKGPIYKGISHK